MVVKVGERRPRADPRQIQDFDSVLFVVLAPAARKSDRASCQSLVPSQVLHVV